MIHMGRARPVTAALTPGNCGVRLARGTGARRPRLPFAPR